MDMYNGEFQKQAQEAAEAFRAVFVKMQEELPTKAVLSGMAAAMAERGISLAPDGMPLDEAAEHTVDMVRLYCAQVVIVLTDDEEDAA